MALGLFMSAAQGLIRCPGSLGSGGMASKLAAAKIAGRDYFSCPLAEQARSAVARCADDLAAFEAEAFSAATSTADDAPARSGGRRRVDRVD